MLSRKNWIYLTVFILALFELSPVIAKEASPRNTVEILLSSITNLKTGEPLTPAEVKENDKVFISTVCFIRKVVCLLAVK